MIDIDGKSQPPNIRHLHSMVPNMCKFPTCPYISHGLWDVVVCIGLLDRA